MSLASIGGSTLAPFQPMSLPDAVHGDLVASAPSRPDATLRALAAELHDGLAQALFAARLDVDELLASDELPGPARRQLERLSARLGDSSNALRSVLHRLFQTGSGTDPCGSVTDRVRDSVEECYARCEFTGDIRVSGSGVEPGAAESELLVRSVREALANISKHANASHVLVSLRRGRAWWTVEIEDDGVGDSADVRTRLSQPVGLSFGLSSLADEAARVGGRLWVSRAQRLAGISLSVSVPVGLGC